MYSCGELKRFLDNNDLYIRQSIGFDQRCVLSLDERRIDPRLKSNRIFISRPNSLDNLIKLMMNLKIIAVPDDIIASTIVSAIKSGNTKKRVYKLCKDGYGYSLKIRGNVDNKQNKYFWGSRLTDLDPDLIFPTFSPKK
jgi:hypothetical protein